MGNKGGKKNTEKIQNHSNNKHKQRERDKVEKQRKGQPLQDLLSEEAADRDNMAIAVRANMKAVEKTQSVS